MRLQRLWLVDFRNYAAAELGLSEGANVFLGPNGAGKTNLLEAIHLVVTGISPRAGRDRDMVRSGFDAFSVRARLGRDDFPGTIECQVVWSRREGKVVRRAGKALTGIGRSMVLGSAVLFSPDDLDLVKGSPSSRRDFLDMATAKAFPRYRGLQRKYAAALAHRNRLLALGEITSRSALLAQLQPWTQQLAGLGAEVLRNRLFTLAQLVEPAQKAYERLGGPGEALGFIYLPSGAAETGEVATGAQPLWDAAMAPGVEQLAGYLAGAFAQRQPDELIRRMTLVGPHRDDVLLTLGGSPVRTFGSQGQQRSVALALRLAENAYLRKALQDTPLLLLDDVFSELDSRRRAGLLTLLREAGEGHQTFLTGTDLAGVPVEGFAPLTVYQVSGGTVVDTAAGP